MFFDRSSGLRLCVEKEHCKFRDSIWKFHLEHFDLFENNDGRFSLHPQTLLLEVSKGGHLNAVNKTGILQFALLENTNTSYF